jgi:hypothetical protein
MKAMTAQDFFLKEMKNNSKLYSDSVDKKWTESDMIIFAERFHNAKLGVLNDNTDTVKINFKNDCFNY